MSSAWDGLANTTTVTELPHYAVNKSLPEDSYYTDREVAEHCVSSFNRALKKHKVDLSGYTFIEPSAGEGCFFDLLPDGNKKIGLDIHPRNHTGIQRADFLTWYPKNRKCKYVVIGNPPFGVRGAIALAFINRSFLFADMVAFILPMSFHSNGKGSNMKRVYNASLMHTERLDGDSFYTPNTRERVPVNTVFQVWKKGGVTSVFTD